MKPLSEQFEEIKDWIETALDADAHGKWLRAPKFEILQDVAELLTPRFIERLRTAETSIRQDEREKLLNEIKASIDNISQSPEKPQKREWYQEGFKDCLNQVSVICGVKVRCPKCMDIGYRKSRQLDILEKCNCVSSQHD